MKLISKPNSALTRLNRITSITNLALVAFAFSTVLTGCGDKGNNSVTDDGRCTGSFVDDYNSLYRLKNQFYTISKSTYRAPLKAACASFNAQHPSRSCLAQNTQSGGNQMFATSDFSAACQDANTLPVLPRGIDEDGRCTQDFILAYNSVSGQLALADRSTASTQVMRDASQACGDFNTQYPSLRCEAIATHPATGYRTYSSLDHTASCERVTRNLADRDRTPPAPVTPLPPTSVYDLTDMRNVSASRLTIEILPATHKLYTLIEYPNQYAVFGSVETIDPGNPVLSTNCKVISPTSRASLYAGRRITPDAIVNSTNLGRTTIYSTGALTIECRRPNANSITLLDVKLALAGILEFSYAD